MEPEKYMEQPPCFVTKEECCGYVCHLYKVQYGLKNAWFGGFGSVVHNVT